MGSFQQITLGAICVGGAFWMGHYLNNHPVPDNVGDEIAKNGSLSPLESKTSLLEPGTKMGELPNFRTPSRPLVDLPEYDSVQLPPPSQLAPVAKDDMAGSRFLADNLPSTSPTTLKALDQHPTREIVRPDFSQLAANFRNTPLELPPLNGTRPPEPVHSKFQNSNLANAANPTSGLMTNSSENTRPATGASAPNPHLPNASAVTSSFSPFSSSFSSPFSNPISRSTVDSVGESSSTETAAGVVNEMAHQVQTIPTEFNAEDFSPKINDRFAATAEMFQQQLSKNRNQPNRQSVLVSVDAPVGPSEPSEFSPRSNSVISLNESPLTSSMLPPEAPPLDFTPADSARVEYSTAVVADNIRSAKPMVPFGLSEDEKNNLVRLRRPDARQIKLGTTQFTDYETKPGDTLQALSTEFYGRPDFFLDIYIANQKQLRNPAQVPAGLTLKIPVYE